MLRVPRWINAVIPAAGRSRRMGTHKLLLEIDGETVISRLVRALDMACVSRIHVLVRAQDQPLIEALRGLPVRIIQTADDTADMKASVRTILEVVQQEIIPNDDDAWLLIPADHPVIDPVVVDRLIECGDAHRDSMIVPTHDNRRGHPVLFPWKLAAACQQIPADQGVNWLLHSGETEVIEVPVESAAIHWDLDTPEDVEQLREWLNSRRTR